MPLITAVLAVSRVLRRLLGEDETDDEGRKARIAGSQRYLKDYNEEFVRYFPTVLSVLVGRKTSIPRLTTAYDHLEKVRELLESLTDLCMASTLYVIAQFCFLQSLNYNAFGGGE